MQKLPDDIKILGHRGMRGRLLQHENTLDAFDMALTAADGVETDVVLSADGVPFLLHDTSIRHIPYVGSKVFSTWKKHLDIVSRWHVGRRTFRQLYSHEIDQLELRSGSKIPRLSDLFSLLARNRERRAFGLDEEDAELGFLTMDETGDRKIINLELKAPESARPVLEAIDLAEKKGQIDRSQIIISSFDHNEIAMAQKIDPFIKTGLIFWQNSFRPCRLYPQSDKYLSKALPASIENLEDERIRRILPDYFVLPVKGLTAVFNDAVAMEYPKSKFIVWTPGCEPLPHINRALHKKLSDPAISPRIAAVITNHPLDMKRCFEPYPG